MAEQLTPASISPFRLWTVECRLFWSNSLSFTLLSKNARANHLESHSCKNKGLKVPCFHTLTKKGVGEGGSTGFSLCAAPNLLWFHESPITSHRSLFASPAASILTNFASATPLDSALTSKRASKSFTSNTYEKHTGGEGRGPAEFRISRFEFRLSVTPLWYPNQRQWNLT
jgi:hypothetical protein